MSLVELIAVFTIGVITGAYGCWLGREYIELGIALLKRDKEKEALPFPPEQMLKHEGDDVHASQQTNANPKNEVQKL